MDVFPSFLGRRSDEYYDGDLFDNLRLRIGEVQESIYPKDKRNLSGKFIEYRVLVQHRANGTAVTKMYDHVVMSSIFGSQADFVRWVPRADTTARNKGSNGIGLGAKVLMLCINGESDNAVIIGALRDAKGQTDEDIPDDDGKPHFYSVFNGLVINVDKDGQLTITRNGATDKNGKARSDVDTSKTGQVLQLDKDGHVVIKHKEGVLTGDATDHTLLGESFRNAQKQMNQQLKAQLDALQKLLVQMAAQLNAAVSTAPGVPLPQVVAAGGIMQGAAQVVAQMSQTVDSFEQSAAQKNSFLSQKNKSD